jgi:hypothetical protein
MPERNSPFDFLRNKPALVVTVVLVAEIIVFYALPTKEYVPSPPPLEAFARNLGPWAMTREYPLTPEEGAILKADDTLTFW